MCNDTSPTHSYQPFSLSTTIAQRNARPRSTAAPPFLPTVLTIYKTRAELWLISPAVFFDILEKAAFTAQTKEINMILRDSSFAIQLLKTDVRQAGDCRGIVLKLTKSYQNMHFS